MSAGVLPTTDTVPAAAEARTMANFDGGVTLVGAAEVDQVTTRDGVAEVPRDGALLVFKVTGHEGCPRDGGCAPWNQQKLSVAIGSRVVKLPPGKGSYAVGVPADAVGDVALRLKDLDFTQSVSLPAQEPGVDNIAVLARPDVKTSLKRTVTLTETLTSPNASSPSTPVREVTVRGASLGFYGWGTNAQRRVIHPRKPDQAYLFVDVDWVYDDDPPGFEPTSMDFREVRLRLPNGKLVPAVRNNPDGDPYEWAFPVTGQFTKGVLYLGGESVDKLASGQPVTSTLSRTSSGDPQPALVPIQF